MKKVFVTILVVLGIEFVAWFVLVFSGAYNVSNVNHDNPFINWWLAHGTTRSIKIHAHGIAVPDLDNPAMVQEGFKHYDEMCVECHGAPGQPPEEIAKGLWPAPPDLDNAASPWTPGQLFWITKNGIRFSGMPAWGPTHDDREIWAITAFLQKLPKLSAADYRQMKTNTVGSQEPGDPHKHGSPSPD